MPTQRSAAACSAATGQDTATAGLPALLRLSRTSVAIPQLQRFSSFPVAHVDGAASSVRTLRRGHLSASPEQRKEPQPRAPDAKGAPRSSSICLRRSPPSEITSLVSRLTAPPGADITPLFRTRGPVRQAPSASLQSPAPKRVDRDRRRRSGFNNTPRVDDGAPPAPRPPLARCRVGQPPPQPRLTHPPRPRFPPPARSPQ